MPSVRPFKFTGLRQFTREQVALQKSMSAFLSYKPFRRRWGKELGTQLETYLKSPCRFSKPEMSVLTGEEVARVLPEVGCFLVVGAAPTEQKILVDLDSGIASYCIDRLLGGSGDVGRIQRPLTEIEQGVLSFVLFKVMEAVHAGWENGRQLTLTLDRFLSRTSDLSDLVQKDSPYHVLGFKLGAGKRVGYARVIIPDVLVTSSFASVPDQGPSTDAELDYMRGVLDGLGPFFVSARVEAATLDLTPDDIAQIEPGDIIILENHQLQLGPEGVVGQAFMKLGRGVNGGLRGNVVIEGELCKFQIAEIVIQEQPPEVRAMADSDEPSVEDLAAELEDGPAPARGEDNLGQTEGLLRDVDAPVVVELGRLKLNTHQVVKLKAGQILRLPRGPKDPVNLVVNGKLFARGELIEVDGELGVRLMQVVGG